MSLNINEFVQRRLETQPRDFKGNYTPDELHELCRRSVEILKNEPSLVRLGFPVLAVGDLFGNYKDLWRVFQINSQGGVNGAYLFNYMFLGNYVDHGKRSLETISLLLGLKVLNPQNYALLRGNHEIAEINRKEGFFDELVRKFGKLEGERLFEHFNEVFSWLPFAGLIDRRGLCVHGGISPYLRCLEDIEKIPRPLADPSTNPLANDLLNAEFDPRALRFRRNPNRPSTVLFGEENVVKAICDLYLVQIIRGDLFCPKGIEFHCNFRMISIFTSTGFKNNNKGSFVEFSNRRIGESILEPEREEEEDDDSGDTTDEEEKNDDYDEEEEAGHCQCRCQ